MTTSLYRYIFFNFMYILYINFRKISNFQVYTSQPHSLSLSLHNPRLDKFESKTTSLTGGLLGLVITQLYGLSTTNYPLCIASCYRQPTLRWIYYKHYPTFCLCKPRPLFIAVGQQLSTLPRIFQPRTPIGGLVTLLGFEPRNLAVKGR